MINIYQLFPRLFGNKNQSTAFNGSILDNGCGKFDDINVNAVQALKELGITHVWLTGVIRHAKLTDYNHIGIPKSHPAVVKGRAGSPYAISDYYDVDPDLAMDPSCRMQEFGHLLNRIHAAGLKILLDFVPNHLAREYRSVARPDGVVDFGTDDRPERAFDRDNNFYYIPNQSFVPPYRPEALYQSEHPYLEQPARATGNDCFSAMPGLNDWFETVKLNYGIDYQNDWQKNFDPVPDTWKKMLHIVLFWASKGIDGFRVDMAEMVPVAFWEWLISKVRAVFPKIIFIAEIYQPGLYADYVAAGFDYLYDKVGLYNRLEGVLVHGQSVEYLSQSWLPAHHLNSHMLRFMENHDEPRLASPRFYGFPFAALPAVALSAWMHPNAFLIYNGQESGETALGSPGFSGDDGRTSIFDYCHMPEHQRWMNNGLFDGGQLDYDQRKLRKKYQAILQLRITLDAFLHGEFYDLMWANPWYTDFDPWHVFVFLRFTKNQRLLIVLNFHRFEQRTMRINMHQDVMQRMGMVDDELIEWQAVDLLEQLEPIFFKPAFLPDKGLNLSLGPSQFVVLQLEPIVQTTKKDHIS